MSNNDVFESLNPQEKQVLQQVQRVLASTKLFTEVGLVKEKKDDKVRIYAKPRFIFDDMVDVENGISAEFFTYSSPMPGDHYQMTQSEIFSNAHMVTMGLMKAYVVGNRKLVLTTEPTKPIDEDNDATPAPQQNVAD